MLLKSSRIVKAIDLAMWKEGNYPIDRIIRQDLAKEISQVIAPALDVECTKFSPSPFRESEFSTAFLLLPSYQWKEFKKCLISMSQRGDQRLYEEMQLLINKMENAELYKQDAIEYPKGVLSPDQYL